MLTYTECLNKARAALSEEPTACSEYEDAYIFSVDHGHDEAGGNIVAIMKADGKAMHVPAYASSAERVLVRSFKIVHPATVRASTDVKLADLLGKLTPDQSKELASHINEGYDK